MKSVGIYEARTRLSELLSRVAEGEEVTVTRHGVPIAKIVPIYESNTAAIREAIAAMERFGRGKSLRGLSLKKMIAEGRR
jgi:prevent-host-death family protein